MDGGQKCKSASLNQSKRAVSCGLGAQAAAAATAGYVHCGGAEARNAIRESEPNDGKKRLGNSDAGAKTDPDVHSEQKVVVVGVVLRRKNR